MGGGGGKKTKKPAVEYAQPLDYAALMRSSSEAATAQVGEQYKQLIANYPKLEELSLGTVGKIATGLDNRPTQEAQSYIRRALELADADPNVAEPTSIEQGLYNAGERELALGRSLSPEQVRESQQAARAAMSARGLGTGAGAAAAEVLNRDSYASARERERQGFASAANDQFIKNVANRRLALANLYTAGAGNLMATDPYSRALGPGLGLGINTQGNQMQQIGNTFSSANQMAGSVASFNANLLDSRANSQLNNWASMNAARMQSSALGQQGMMGMAGGIGGGLLMGAGLAI